MIRVNLINGIIVLGSDGNDLLTMAPMDPSVHKTLLEGDLEVFRDITARDVQARFDEVEPHFATEEDRADAINLVTAKYREEPGTSGVQKDTGERPNESR